MDSSFLFGIILLISERHLNKIAIKKKQNDNKSWNKNIVFIMIGLCPIIISLREIMISLRNLQIKDKKMKQKSYLKHWPDKKSLTWQKSSTKTCVPSKTKFETKIHFLFLSGLKFETKNVNLTKIHFLFLFQIHFLFLSTIFCQVYSFFCL